MLQEYTTEDFIKAMVAEAREEALEEGEKKSDIKWQGIVADKDAALADKDAALADQAAENARLREQLAKYTQASS